MGIVEVGTVDEIIDEIATGGIEVKIAPVDIVDENRTGRNSNLPNVKSSESEQHWGYVIYHLFYRINTE